MREVIEMTRAFCLLLMFCMMAAQASECANIGDSLKGFGGVSTREVEEARGSALAKTFNYDYKTCYAMVEKILSKMPKTSIYSKSERLIAVYYKDPNSTPVGVFIVPASPTRTQVQVSSESVSAKEWVARNLFSEKVLDATPDNALGMPEKEKKETF